MRATARQLGWLAGVTVLFKSFSCTCSDNQIKIYFILPSLMSKIWDGDTDGEGGGNKKDNLKKKNRINLIELTHVQNGKRYLKCFQIENDDLFSTSSSYIIYTVNIT